MNFYFTYVINLNQMSGLSWYLQKKLSWSAIFMKLFKWNIYEKNLHNYFQVLILKSYSQCLFFTFVSKFFVLKADFISLA